MKHKSALTGFSYLAGLICAYFFGNFITASFVCAAGLLIISLSLNKRGKSAAAAAVFIMSAAMCVYNIYTLTVYLPITSLDGKTAEISGTITDVHYYGNDTASYTIKTAPEGIEAYIIMFAQDNGGGVGDNIRLTAKLSALKDNGLFSEKSYYRSKGIFLSASPKSEAIITPCEEINPKKLVYDYSDYIGDRISRLLTGDEGDILKAMFLGDRSGLSDGLAENIKRAGVNHFTAVSGLHLTIISHIVLLLISLTPLKHHRYFKFTVLVLIILLFMLFFKLSASVIRAGIMLIIYYGAEPAMRKGSTLNSLGAAVLLITLFDPYSCTDASLLLSLAGTFGAGVLAPYVTNLSGKKKLAPIIASLCAILCTLPLSFIYFGGFSLVGVFANILLIPLFLPAMICTFVFALLGGNGTGLMFISGLCAKGMIFVINFLGGLKYSYFPTDYSFTATIGILAAGYTALVSVYFKNITASLKAIAVSVCVLLLFTAVSEVYYSDKAKLTMYSDGQDACVIAEYEGSVFITASNDSEKLLNCINAYINDNFIDEISAAVLLNSGHNNLSGFRNLPCKVFLPPESAKEVYSDKISLKCEKGVCTVAMNGVSITVSPAKEPKDDEIAVLYGYTGKEHKLEGTVFVSSKRLYSNTENNEYISLYYDKAAYIITDSGLLQNRN